MTLHPTAGTQVISNSPKLHCFRPDRMPASRVPTGSAVVTCGLFVCLALVWLPLAAEAARPAPPSAARRPVALAWHAGERQVLVANRDRGTVSVVRTEPTPALVAEHPLGTRLSALATSGEWLLATDESRHELIVAQLEGGRCQIEARLPVPPYPVDVVVSPEEPVCYVSSLWSRRVSRLAWSGKFTGPCAERSCELDFPPRKLLLLEQHSLLLVADGFGGRLALLDAMTLELRAEHQIPAHNMRGLAIDPQQRMVLIAHQMLNERARSERNDVHWGLLISNDLRWFPLTRMLGPTTELYTGARIHPLGEAGRATGDPTAVEVAQDGTVVVALGGVGEIAVGREGDFALRRVPVGRRPVAVMVPPGVRQAHVANMFDDSLSVVDLDRGQVVTTVSLGSGPPPELTPVQRGEQLFYDAQLSHDGWMSCHSCHPDGHTNGLKSDNLSDGGFGAPKRVLSLLGRDGTAPYGWTGSAANLESQIRKSILKTMQGDEPTDDQVSSLAAYLRSLPPPPSALSLGLSLSRLGLPQTGLPPTGLPPAGLPQTGLPPADDSPPAGTLRRQLAAGRQLFNKLGCAECHQPPTYTSPDVYDVGLTDETGSRAFNPPTLRGVGQRGPYFHDGRAATLRELLTPPLQHQLPRELDATELTQLLVWLSSL